MPSPSMLSTTRLYNATITSDRRWRPTSANASQSLDQHTRRSLENIIRDMRGVRVQFDEGMSSAAATAAAVKRGASPK